MWADVGKWRFPFVSRILLAYFKAQDLILKVKISIVGLFVVP